MPFLILKRKINKRTAKLMGAGSREGLEK